MARFEIGGRGREREMAGRVVGVRGVGGGGSWHLDRKGIEEWVYACRASERVGVCGGYFISWSDSEVETTARFFTSGFKVMQITSEVLI